MAIGMIGDIGKALVPLATKFAGIGYNNVVQNYKEIFEVRNTDRAFEESTLLYGFGDPAIIHEGESVQYDKIGQAYTKQYKYDVFGMGYILTERAVMDNKAPEVAAFRSKDLGAAMAQMEDRKAWDVINNAFSAGVYAGPDGVALMSASHPTAKAGLQSNVLSTASQLNELALEQLLIQIRRAKDDAGRQIMLLPEKLVIPPELEYEAKRILGSELQYDNANNALNALKSLGRLQSGPVMSVFLSDTNNWFIKTNAPEGLIHYERYGMKMDQDKVFDTDNLHYKAKMAFANGFTNWRCLFGSNPA